MFKKAKEENKEIKEQDINNPFSENAAIEDTTKAENTEEKDIKKEKEEKCAKNIESEKLKNELNDLNNKYVRLAADFDNFRKRQAQERENLLKYGAEETLKKFLIVLDTLERGKEQIDKLDDIEKVKESYDVITKQFMGALEKCGLKKIEAEGQKFDPNFHEAVMQTPTSEYEDQVIIQQMQSGYQLGEKVLRPAMVNVAVNEENN